MITLSELINKLSKHSSNMKVTIPYGKEGYDNVSSTPTLEVTIVFYNEDRKLIRELGNDLIKVAALASAANPALL